MCGFLLSTSNSLLIKLAHYKHERLFSKHVQQIHSVDIYYMNLLLRSENKIRNHSLSPSDLILISLRFLLMSGRVSDCKTQSVDFICINGRTELLHNRSHLLHITLSVPMLLYQNTLISLTFRYLSSSHSEILHHS